MADNGNRGGRRGRGGPRGRGRGGGNNMMFGLGGGFKNKRKRFRKGKRGGGAPSDTTSVSIPLRSGRLDFDNMAPNVYNMLYGAENIPQDVVVNMANSAKTIQKMAVKKNRDIINKCIGNITKIVGDGSVVFGMPEHLVSREAKLMAVKKGNTWGDQPVIPCEKLIFVMPRPAKYIPKAEFFNRVEIIHREPVYVNPTQELPTVKWRGFMGSKFNDVAANYTKDFTDITPIVNMIKVIGAPSSDPGSIPAAEVDRHIRFITQQVRYAYQQKHFILHQVKALTQLMDRVLSERKSWEANTDYVNEVDNYYNNILNKGGKRIKDESIDIAEYLNSDFSMNEKGRSLLGQSISNLYESTTNLKDDYTSYGAGFRDWPLARDVLIDQGVDPIYVTWDANFNAELANILNKDVHGDVTGVMQQFLKYVTDIADNKFESKLDVEIPQVLAEAGLTHLNHALIDLKGNAKANLAAEIKKKGGSIPPYLSDSATNYVPRRYGHDQAVPVKELERQIAEMKDAYDSLYKQMQARKQRTTPRGNWAEPTKVQEYRQRPRFRRRQQYQPNPKEYYEGGEEEQSAHEDDDDYEDEDYDYRDPGQREQAYQRELRELAEKKKDLAKAMEKMNVKK